jgi:predicted RNA-binding protein
MNYNYLSQLKGETPFQTRLANLIANGNPVQHRDAHMCEFNVILNGKTLFKDVVYAKTEKNGVVVKNVLGETKQFSNCKITVVDVNSTKLILEPINP